MKEKLHRWQLEVLGVHRSAGIFTRFEMQDAYF
jgi:hypothetical protein